MRLTITIVAVLAVLAVASCDRSSTRGIGSAAAAPATATLGSNGNSLTLPLSPYYPSAQALEAMTNMQSVLMSRCATRAGYQFPVIVSGPVSYGTDPGYGRFYDFGVTSPRLARTHGYHGLSVTISRRTASGAPVPDVLRLPSPEQFVLQRCIRNIVRQSGQETGNWSGLVQQLASQAWTRARQDPAVVSVIGHWSACMTARGYHYTGPVSASRDISSIPGQRLGWSTPDPTRLEIATATADVMCKRQTRLLTVWIAALAHDQRQLLRQYLPGLRAGITKFAHIVAAERRAVAQQQ